MSKPVVYISTDVETDGPIPGPNSMLSIGSVAFEENGEEISCFSRNLEPLPGSVEDSDTMKWWAQHQIAWEACRSNTVPPERAMREYDLWIRNLGGRPIFVAYPVSFDMLFVLWYLRRYSNSVYSAIDIRSFAMGKLGISYQKTRKADLPKALMPKARHDHVAVDDAREQGRLFMSLLRQCPMESRTSKQGEKLSTDESRSFYSSKCPDCGKTVVEGPSGGLSINYACRDCGSRFNDCGPFGVERISDAGASPKNGGDEHSP